MRDFIIKEIITENIESELRKIGFDSCYVHKAADKYKYKTIKIYDLNPAQANILKQTALSIGADCGVHREVITGKIEISDAILGGSFSQLEKISSRLKEQPFSLKNLGEKIENLVQAEQTRKTKLAGILNLTPDSFSDGGKYYGGKYLGGKDDKPDAAFNHFIEMIEDGADLIDIGAESTRPGAEDVEPKIQIERLKPLLDKIQKENITFPMSIDTRSSEVARFALDYGIEIINDVSGLEYDPKMVDVAAEYGAGIIIQHSKGNPAVMQQNPVYDDVIEEIYSKLLKKVDFAHSKGIKNIIIDPGIGFGKTKKDNFEILDRIEEFYSLNCPVMVGVSRKSLLGVNGENNELKDSLSAAISYPLIKSGVDYLRVHNVKLHKQLISLAE